MRDLRIAALLACSVVLAAGATADVVSFRQGANRYNGTSDTWIQVNSGTNNGNNGTLMIDLSGTGWNMHALIKFDKIFMSEGGPIPNGVQINSATLRLVCNDTGSGWMFHRMLMDWAETDTWLTSGSPTRDGVTTPNVEYLGDTGSGAPRTGYYDVDAIVDGVSSGTSYTVDVTTSLQAWSDGTAPNYGWVVHSLSSTSSGFVSPEGASSSRPLLRVDYVGTTIITGFTISDQTSGETFYTDSPTVNVSMAVILDSKATFLQYMITETATQPAAGDPGWSGTEPASHTIAGPQGPMILYAWVKDDLGTIAGAEATILYDTSSPVISNVVTTPAVYSIEVSWSTSVTAVGWMTYGQQGGALDQTSEVTFYGFSHSVTLTGLSLATTYDLEIHSNASSHTVSVTTLDPRPTNDDLAWTGNAGMLWSDSMNWNPLQPPADGTTGTLSFLEIGSSREEGVVTSTVDPQNLFGGSPADTTWKVSGIRVDCANRFHTVALFDDDEFLEKTLTITGGLTVSTGTFAPIDGFLGFNPSAGIHLADVRNEAPNREGVLDLTHCRLVNNALNVDQLTAGTDGSDLGTRGKLVIKNTTGLQRLQVDSFFALGARLTGSSACNGYVGNPDNNWRLPANVDIQFGTGTNPCVVELGSRGSAGGHEGIMRASAGGTFTAYVSEMKLGHYLGDRTNGAVAHRGILDLAGMDGCTGRIDVLRIGVIEDPPPGGDDELDGLLSLPPGTIATGTIELGEPYIMQAESEGKLTLKGTVVTVSIGLTIHPTGRLESTVSGTSAGLDLASGATLSVAGGGSINITFDAPQDPPGGRYWGLRWEGDRVPELRNLKNQGKIAWDHSLLELPAGEVVSIFNGRDGFTYIGVNTASLEGDVNDDCVVNILDLIGIRNLLNADPTSPPENAVYDVTGDGRIDILDMIFVRNRINDTCPEV